MNSLKKLLSLGALFLALLAVVPVAFAQPATVPRAGGGGSGTATNLGSSAKSQVTNIVVSMDTYEVRTVLNNGLDIGDLVSGTYNGVAVVNGDKVLLAGTGNGDDGIYKIGTFTRPSDTTNPPPQRVLINEGTFAGSRWWLSFDDSPPAYYVYTARSNAALVRAEGTNAVQTVQLNNINALTNQIGSASGGGSSINYLFQDGATTNSLIQDVSSVWWRHAHTNIGLAMTPVYLADAPVLKTNGYYTLNTLGQATNGGDQYKVFPVQAPAGATTAKFQIDAMGIAAVGATNAVILSVISSNYASEVALVTNTLFANSWSNVVLNFNVTAGNVYLLAIHTAKRGQLTNGSFAVRNLNLTWNNTPGSNSIDAFHSINNEPNLLPWFGSRVSFVSTSSVVGLDIWSDTTNMVSKWITIKTNGLLYTNLLITNYSGVYTVNFGSASRRELSIFNGPQNDTGYRGTNRFGTWVRKVFVSEPALTFDRISKPSILVIGNSISAGYTVTNYTLSWQGQIEDSYGIYIANRSAAFWSIRDYNTNLPNPWVKAISEVNPPTVWITMGGVNEVNGCNCSPFPDHFTAVSNVAHSARFEFPGKTFIWFTEFGVTPSSASLTISNAVNRSGIPVYPGEDLLPDNSYKADGTHPNEKGSARIAGILSDLVRTNYAIVLGASTLEFIGTNFVVNLATNTSSVAIGPLTTAAGRARTFSSGGVAIGDGTVASFRGVGIGFQATNGGNQSVALGNSVFNEQGNSIGIGLGVYNPSQGSGIGENLHTSGQYSFSIGRLSTNTAGGGGGAFLIGNQSRLGAGSAFASGGTYLLGAGSIIAGNSEGLNLLWGNGSVITNTANGNGVSGSIIVGHTNLVTATNAAAFGSRLTNALRNSLVFGFDAPYFWATATNFGVTNGIGSYATNATVAIVSTGITNTLKVNYRLFGLTGVSVVQTNPITAIGFARGTITVPSDVVLQPNEFVMGSSVAVQGAQAF